MAADTAEGRRQSLREAGEQLARIQGDEQGHWLFRLWLELLAYAGRDDQFRELAGGFWSGTRELMTTGIRGAYDDAGEQPPADPQRLATAMIALDIGLALQHFVDPEAVPLDVYPELYELLFQPHAPSTAR
jgi:hypothetical protein